MDIQTAEQLVPFLRELADSIESKEVVPQQLRSIGDFFMSYKFQEQALKDSQIDSDKPSPGNVSPTELTKFLFMGWYIYQVLLRSEKLDPIQDND